MRFDYLLVGIVIFGLLITAGLVMINDFNENYVQTGMVNTTVDNSSIGKVYNKINDIYNVSEQANEKVLKGDISSGTTSWESMIAGSYSAITLMSKSYAIFTDIMNAIAGEIGIPFVVVQTLFICLSLTIIFSLIYMIFRFIPR